MEGSFYCVSNISHHQQQNQQKYKVWDKVKKICDAKCFLDLVVKWISKSQLYFTLKYIACCGPYCWQWRDTCVKIEIPVMILLLNTPCFQKNTSANSSRLRHGRDFGWSSCARQEIHSGRKLAPCVNQSSSRPASTYITPKSQASKS